MNLVVLMTLALRFWKKDWLKLKSYFWTVNHRYIVQGPMHKTKEVFGRAQGQTPLIQSNLYFLMSFIHVVLLGIRELTSSSKLSFIGLLRAFLNLVSLATCVSFKIDFTVIYRSSASLGGQYCCLDHPLMIVPMILISISNTTSFEIDTQPLMCLSYAILVLFTIAWGRESSSIAVFRASKYTLRLSVSEYIGSGFCALHLIHFWVYYSLGHRECIHAGKYFSFVWKSKNMHAKWFWKAAIKVRLD